MPEKLCQVCKMVGIEGCPNTLEYPAGGSILRYRGEDIVSEVCPNMRVFALKQRLLKADPQLLTVPHDSTTPLYQTGGADRTLENLFLRHTDWKHFLSHFKWVLASKDPSFFVRIVTDAMLKQVYVGDASVRARLPEQREDGELQIFNSLEDLLASADLVIIRVGFLIYFNKAMASILLEALKLREGMGKPTWIVEPDDQEFKPWFRTDYGAAEGMPCCNDEVYRYVRGYFQALQLGAGSKAVSTVEEDGNEVSVPGHQEVEAGPIQEEESTSEPDEPRVSKSAVPADDEYFQKITDRKSRGQSGQQWKRGTK